MASPAPTSATLTKAAESYVLTATPDKFTLSGCLIKRKANDPRVLGDAQFFDNQTPIPYYLTDFSYDLDARGLRAGESVESDVGLSITPSSIGNSLNSGEEVFVTHIHDATPIDHGQVKLDIPPGGLIITSGKHLSIGSTSGIFPEAGGGAVVVDDARVADGSLMRLCYTAVFASTLASGTMPISSYRSPFRDRDYVADPARSTAPYTDFRNPTDHVIHVSGLGTFVSNLSDSEPSEHSLQIYVNGKLIKDYPLPSHVPGISTPLIAPIIPVDIDLQPGDVISARGTVKAKRAIVFDFATFIFAGSGLASTNEQLEAAPADLNGDGLADLVDIDGNGSIWVGLRVGQGLQDTQQEWARSVRNVSRLAQTSTAGSSPVVLQATNAAGLCLNLTARPTEARFILDYCQNSLGPSLPTDIWGDFTGDGFIDRLRIDQAALSYNVAPGGPNGLTTQSPWIQGYGAVDRIFVSDANHDGKDDFESEFSQNGLVCTIWLSTGTQFDRTDC